MGTPEVTAAPRPVEPGQEPNLHLADCLRCGEARYHLFLLDGDFPLWAYWRFKCGECGLLSDLWESLPTRWSTPLPGQTSAVYPDEDDLAPGVTEEADFVWEEK